MFAGAYGVVTMPFGVRDGINIFLAGFVPTENLRFRTEHLTFKISENPEDLIGMTDLMAHKYPNMVKTLIEKKTNSKFRSNPRITKFSQALSGSRADTLLLKTTRN